MARVARKPRSPRHGKGGEPPAGDTARRAGEPKPGSTAGVGGDLKSLPLAEVERQLGYSSDGLTQIEAQRRLAEYGPNEIEEKRPIRCRYGNHIKSVHRVAGTGSRSRREECSRLARDGR